MALLSTFWTDFLGRFDGPLHFRLFVQPLMAMLFATRNGRRDAREGRSAYLWDFSPIPPSVVTCSKADGKESLRSLFSPLHSMSSISLWNGTG